MATKKKAQPAAPRKGRSGPSGPSGINRQPRFTLRAPPEAFDDWQAFADAAGLPLNRWIQDACNEFCQQTLRRESVSKYRKPKR
jgi:hypothetical protein